jgi:hypothetical protein
MGEDLRNRRYIEASSLEAGKEAFLFGEGRSTHAARRAVNIYAIYCIEVYNYCARERENGGCGGLSGEC